MLRKSSYDRQRESQKTYLRTLLIRGGAKVKVFRKLMTKKPEFIIETAVKGMLPKTKLAESYLKN